MGMPKCYILGIMLQLSYKTGSGWQGESMAVSVLSQQPHLSKTDETFPSSTTTALLKKA